MKYTRTSLIEKLTDMGIPVVAGKVNKEDVKRVLARLISAAQDADWDWENGAKDILEELSSLFVSQVPDLKRGPLQRTVEGYTYSFSGNSKYNNYSISVGPDQQNVGEFVIWVTVNEAVETKRIVVEPDSLQRSANSPGSLVKFKKRKQKKDFWTNKGGLAAAKKWVSKFEPLTAN